jgi:hypothetical protein
MCEELHEILQNSGNEEYVVNKHSKVSNEETHKVAHEAQEIALQVEDRKLPLLHIPSIKYLHVSLE